MRVISYTRNERVQVPGKEGGSSERESEKKIEIGGERGGAGKKGVVVVVVGGVHSVWPGETGTVGV